MRKIFSILCFLISFCFSSSENSLFKDGDDAVKIRIGGCQWVGDYDKLQWGYGLAGIKSPFMLYIYNWDVYKYGIGIKYNYFIKDNIYSGINFHSYTGSHNNNLRYNTTSIMTGAFQKINESIDFDVNIIYNKTYIENSREYDSFGLLTGFNYSIKDFMLYFYNRVVLYNEDTRYGFGVNMSYQYIF